MQGIVQRRCLSAAGASSRPAAPAVVSTQPARTAVVQRVAAVDKPSPSSSATAIPAHKDLNQEIREGHYEARLVQAQARKRDDSQPSIASALTPVSLEVTYDAAVVGAGPAGMFLAAELAKRGLRTAVVGLDVPLVNNYGVWIDEYDKLGLSHTLECSWPDTVCYFGEGKQTRIGRAYGRVSRRKLREHLLQVCKEAGVAFLPAEVEGLEVVGGSEPHTEVAVGGGRTMRARLVTLAAGAAGGKFLRYEEGAPSVAAQTAYGVEAEVEGYGDVYDPSVMTFMDFRRHHSGLWDNTAMDVQPGAHPNAGDGMWGTAGEVPSFLYAMPLEGNRVFLEETCLVAKPALPFSVLKRRLDRRLGALGIKVTKIHEVEWSYIPTGGPLPVNEQKVTAFGAAANLVHPATGFSIARSFREAPAVADEVAAVLKQGLPVPQAAQRVWQRLWSQEKRTQAAFHVFGMELLATLDLSETNAFFNTFFALPQNYWRGFLGSSLSANQLLIFAFLTFVYAPWNIKYRLLAHLASDPAGGYMLNGYKLLWDGSQQQPEQQQ